MIKYIISLILVLYLFSCSTNHTEPTKIENDVIYVAKDQRSQYFFQKFWSEYDSSKMPMYAEVPQKNTILDSTIVSLARAKSKGLIFYVVKQNDKIVKVNSIGIEVNNMVNDVNLGSQTLAYLHSPNLPLDQNEFCSFLMKVNPR